MTEHDSPIVDRNSKSSDSSDADDSAPNTAATKQLSITAQKKPAPVKRKASIGTQAGSLSYKQHTLNLDHDDDFVPEGPIAKRPMARPKSRPAAFGSTASAPAPSIGAVTEVDGIDFIEVDNSQLELNVTANGQQSERGGIKPESRCELITARRFNFF